jgi:hypothetical protein
LRELSLITYRPISSADTITHAPLQKYDFGENTLREDEGTLSQFFFNS